MAQLVIIHSHKILIFIKSLFKLNAEDCIKIKIWYNVPFSKVCLPCITNKICSLRSAKNLEIFTQFLKIILSKH